MVPLPEIILSHASTLPEGAVLSPKEFLHQATRAAIDQAFSRLARDGKLIRIDRGAYVAPLPHWSGTRLPSPAKVVEAFALQNGELVAVDGAIAANAFGLTKEVPVHQVYVTSGRTRKIHLGSSEVLLKHVPSWMLALGSGPAGNAVRALAWMGPGNAGKSVATVRKTLPSQDWAVLASSRAAFPSWLAQAIGKEASNGETVS